MPSRSRRSSSRAGSATGSPRAAAASPSKPVSALSALFTPGRGSASPRAGGAPANSLLSASPLQKAASPRKSPGKSPRRTVTGSAAADSVLSFNIRALLKDKLLMYYLVAGFLVVAVTVYLVRDDHGAVHAWARLPFWLQNPYILSAIVLLVLLLTAHATYIGHSGAKESWASILMATFGIVGVAFVVLGYLVYRSHAFVPAFWLSLVLLLGSVFHAYSVWRIHALAGYECFPIVALFAYTTYTLWFMSAEAAQVSACVPEYKAAA